MSERQLTVVIVHWNQAAVCIDTVHRFRSESCVFRTIVVDNGSSIDQLAELRRGIGQSVDAETAQVELLELGHNSGFGPGANRGWERWLDDLGGTEWVALAPHDAEPASGTLDTLLAVGLDSAGPRGEPYGLLSADVGDGAAPFVDHVFGPITRPATSENKVEAVDYPHGTLMLASRSCLKTVGLFDERFFSYCEEADLGLRAKKAGFAVGLVRGASVVNPHVNTPSPMVDYLQERNTVLLVAKHFGRRKAAMRLTLTVWQLIRGVAQPSSRAPYWNAGARGRAILDVLRRSWGRPPPALTKR